MTTRTAPFSARPWWRPALVVGLSFAALIVPRVAAAPGVRVVVLLVFLVLGPGLALVGLLDIPDGWREMSLVIGVSLALDVVVVGVLTYAGDGTASDGLARLAGSALAGAAVQSVRPGRRRRNGKAAA
jgi:hypothetical protein